MARIDNWEIKSRFGELHAKFESIPVQARNSEPVQKAVEALNEAIREAERQAEIAEQEFLIAEAEDVITAARVVLTKLKDDDAPLPF